MKRQMTCIICPRGCVLTAEETDGTITVTGNACKRGQEHAIKECTNPVRSITSTVRVCNREDTMLSVKTEMPIPKTAMFDVMSMLRTSSVMAPVRIGDVILEGVCGTNIIATKAVE